jgi:hypothetical protein
VQGHQRGAKTGATAIAPSSSAKGSIVQNSAIVMARNCGDVPAAVKLKRAAAVS